ncbi:MAG: condensation domain-containing protein, partial [Gammaproteobacteria bacterium]
MELGEIEFLLNQMPGITAAVAHAYIDRNGLNRIAVYVSGPSDQREVKDDIRRRLRAFLPEAFIPASIVILPQLPLNSNGKVDRFALPDPISIESAKTTVVARNETELRLSIIWKELLQAERVGIHDNFFEAGGHSLLASQFAARINQTFSVSIALKTFFEKCTIAELAEIIQREHDGSGEAQHVLYIESLKDEQRRRYELSFAQQRLWFLYKLAPTSHAYHISSAFSIIGNFDTEKFQKALTSTVFRHEVLRTVYTEIAGEVRAERLDEIKIPLDIIDLSQLEEIEQEQTIHELLTAHRDTYFQLDTKIPCRFLLLKRADNDYLFSLTVHHIAFDGWSVHILSRDICHQYNEDRAVDQVDASIQEIQYADFACWQKQYFASPALDQQKAYWLDHLSGDLPELELPTDYSRPAAQSQEGDVVNYRLSTELSQAVYQQCLDKNITPNILLLAVYNALLYRISDADDICVGSPIANRTHPQTQSTVGFFVNTLVMRNKLTEGMNFEALLTQVKENTLNAYENQDVPFDWLVEALQPERSL